MKVAVLIMYELRAVHKTIAEIYQRLIDYYDADVFICCQRQYPEDDERLQLFDRKVKFKQLYVKPPPKDVLGTSFAMMPVHPQLPWNSPASAQFYINNLYISNALKPYSSQYDYFVTMRTDCTYLFDLPPPSLLETLPPAVWCFHPRYARSWGGSGLGTFVPRQYIHGYLECYASALRDLFFLPTLHGHATVSGFNQELFLQLALRYKRIPMRYILDINYYYTGETTSDYTTWAKMMIHPVHNVICKYKEQCDEAYEALDKWNNGWRWGLEEPFLRLVPPTFTDTST